MQEINSKMSTALNERLDALPETKIIETTNSFEAVILDVIQRCNMYYVVLDQTSLKDGQKGIIKYKNGYEEITCVRNQNGIILHITHEPPRKGEIAMIERR